MELRARITAIIHQDSMLLLGPIMHQADHIAHRADHIAHRADHIAHQADHIVHHLVGVASVVVVSVVVVAEDAVVNIFLIGNSAQTTKKPVKYQGKPFILLVFLL